MVSEGHAVPQDWTIAWLVGFLVAILSNDILHCIQLTSTMISIYNNISFPYLGLLLPIHQVIGMNIVDRPLVHHHWYRLSWNYLWILTIILWAAETSTSFLTLVLLMILAVRLSGVLLRNTSIDYVLLMLRVLNEIISSRWPRYLVIWLLLKLLLC